MGYVEDEFCNKTLMDSTNCTLGHAHSKRSADADDGPEAIVVPLTFFFIFCVGVTGNVLLTLNFARHKKLSTPHNALVVNLAVGDLLMLALGVPVNSVWYTLDYWVFGEALCRLSRFSETLATAVTIATLTVLSVERYYIVTGRRRVHQLNSMPKQVIVVIWVVSFLLALPDLISANVVTPPNQSATNSTNTTTTTDSGPVEFCLDFAEDWGEDYVKANIMLKFLLFFCIPLLIIAPFYFLLAFHLLYKMFGSRKSPTSKTPLKAMAKTPAMRQDTMTDDMDIQTGAYLQEASSMEQEESRDWSQHAAAANNSLVGSTSVSKGRGGNKATTPAEKRQRLAWTVLMLVVCFVLCWLPRHVYLLWFHFDPAPFNAIWHVVKISGFCLMFSNSAVNPFVFYVLDLHFRNFVNGALLCRPSGTDGGRGGGGGEGGVGGEENGAANADTMAVDMTVTEADRRTCIVLNHMPPSAHTVDAV
ncbi:neuropeptide CCHamide-1 receptor-like [Babylonia areolata]|uniref:neuropeptide CCHamide-1 receptor-like n=1 Tax=Babylonia areolata TaxID=304850 RepID=UPI003FD103E1